MTTRRVLLLTAVACAGILAPAAAAVLTPPSAPSLGGPLALDPAAVRAPGVTTTSLQGRSADLTGPAPAATASGPATLPTLAAAVDDSAGSPGAVAPSASASGSASVSASSSASGSASSRSAAGPAARSGATPVPAPAARVVDDHGGDRDRDDRDEPGDDRDDRDRDDRDEPGDDRDDRDDD
jgi:hypothetical protein